MKYIQCIIVVCLLLMFSGCSNQDILTAGYPNENGVEFYKEITDKDKIKEVRIWFDNLENLEQPNDLKTEAEADIFVTLANRGIIEILAYIWYIEDGTIIVKRGTSNYYTATSEQTEKLKDILDYKDN
ncbi:hypothetical protein [Alkalithermobacter paradoxus]|uniref:Lipoprotein n=1 Tax=Alkalithermobacter paradoxus TaxID=29349 RepID=A0A1V4I7N6_9FIRM|nr:hypothetical protein CLOTH_11590 [[Clostridium] thermoalcaliphilum]